MAETTAPVAPKTAPVTPVPAAGKPDSKTVPGAVAAPSAPAAGTQTTDSTETAKPMLCGFIIKGERGDKPCVKMLGANGEPHDGDHATRINAKTATAAVTLTAAKLTPKVFAPELKLMIVDADNRSETQALVDGHVAIAHKAWTAAGKPSNHVAAHKAGVLSRYDVEPGEEAAFRALLTQAGLLHDVKVRMFPVQKLVTGERVLPWYVTDKATRGESDKPTGNESSANSGN